MVYGDFKDSARRVVSDKVLHDTAINIVKNLKYDGYQRGLDSMVCFLCTVRVFSYIRNLLLVVLLKVKLCQTSN